MADKLIIIIHNTRWDDMEALYMPLFQAAVAAAMQYETEIILSGHSLELAFAGRAESVTGAIQGKSLYQFMLDAVEAGASIKACGSQISLNREGMIPEIREVVGMAYLVSETMDADTVTFTY